ncbi:hypothetical protein CPAR01_14063 [Colletotrichum paranaense]|nr:uncharacterized protein CCOS01_16670 [Colletotrichum costaricense]XP_060343049.1 uncharacterized protein CPAR01_14063 [Colletotrichum paranaense]XP_060383606.1 uncharacterized protein CTAM01_05907 [Colletotrichum tamarilloi]XP_060394748.1 uncharacterized protein CABS01_13582 [Colletotrichum abscissum]KAI3526987.1 hypothetical protein CSPX01_17328 [Colletotrichum filicis]KAK1462595.1 hypothetical protein CMEL01_13706 [Colletotrichum melonis]KAK1703817.1 hypothetical protein BDP67DRAFT_23465
MRLASLLSATAAAMAVSVQAGGQCADRTASGDAITGFRFSPGCNTWQWYSRDKGTTITLNPDCQLRQAWPNPTAVGYVCIRNKSGGNKCFAAPTAADQNFCGIPADWCNNIENMWGWA